MVLHVHVQNVEVKASHEVSENILCDIQLNTRLSKNCYFVLHLKVEEIDPFWKILFLQ